MPRLMFDWIAYWCLTALVAGDFYPRYPASEPRYNYPLIRNKPYEFRTLVPVAFISSAATPVSVPPMKIRVHENDLLLVKNEGTDVQFVPYDEKCEIATLTGGPVHTERYRFLNVDYGCDGVPNNTRNTDSMDGQSLPIQFLFSFYNERYGSLNNCLRYRDGLVVVAISVGVFGNVPNPAFVPLQKALSRIRKANTTTTIRTKEAVYWLLKTLTSGTPYYSYPGAYGDPPQKTYFCTIDIHPNFDVHPWISYSQYETFTSIRNLYNDPLVSATPVYPLGPRPFIEACGPICVDYC